MQSGTHGNQTVLTAHKRSWRSSELWRTHYSTVWPSHLHLSIMRDSSWILASTRATWGLENHRSCVIDIALYSEFIWWWSWPKSWSISIRCFNQIPKARLCLTISDVTKIWGVSVSRTLPWNQLFNRDCSIPPFSITSRLRTQFFVLSVTAVIRDITTSTRYYRVCVAYSCCSASSPRDDLWTLREGTCCLKLRNFKYGTQPVRPPLEHIGHTSRESFHARKSPPQCCSLFCNKPHIFPWWAQPEIFYSAKFHEQSRQYSRATRRSRYKNKPLGIPE